MDRHRILDHRGTGAIAWLHELDGRCAGDPALFVRYVVVENGHFYRPAPQPREMIMIPRAAVTYEVEIGDRRYALTVCREPRFLLLEELR